MPGSAGVIAFAVAWLAVRVLLSRFARLALDRPNERSLHATPVPRTGGVALVLGVGAGALLGAGPLWLPAFCALGLAAISFIDDLRSLPTLARLAAHLAMAALSCWYLLAPMHPLEVAAAVLAVAWLTNLYNFMDGSDGLAAGMALFGFGALALAAFGAGDTALAVFSASIAGAAAAFLRFNFSPARIFLGDVGSVPLGFLAGALGLAGWRSDDWPLWFPLLVFAPFIFDATVTLLRRLARGEPVWRAHREHYYQRAVRMGAGHRATALAAYVLMLACGSAALYARTRSVEVQAIAGALSGGLLIGAAVWIDVRWAREVASRQART
jgi:UDP-GlcNAc:undecaprenyl-phosphate GlcNAc-1-phosphate transferase